MDQYQFNEFNQEEIDLKLVRKYSDFEKSDLSKIITKYINYEPKAARAALYVSVDKGYISYDMKESLWKQMEVNYRSRRLKTHSWESNNSFVPYFATWSDDQIYDLIDNPDGIALDAYHAVLMTAKLRELISGEDCRTYFYDAKADEGNEDGVRKSSFGKLIRAGNDDMSFLNDNELKAAERENYWKCPQCNQLVGMEFGVCWNCQAEIPDTVEHPDVKEIILEKDLKPFSFIRSGFYMIAGGLVVGFLEYLRPMIGFHRHLNYVGVIFGGIFVVAGVFVVFYGLFFDSDPGKR